MHFFDPILLAATAINLLEIKMISISAASGGDFLPPAAAGGRVTLARMQLTLSLSLSRE